MLEVYAAGYGGTETLLTPYNTTTRAATVHGHMGTGALQPRVKGKREHGDVGAKEYKRPFNTACSINCGLLWLITGSCLFYGDKTFFMLLHRLRKESNACVPSHHHTVHSGTDLNSCHLCAQAPTKRGRRQSRTPRFKQRPGEQTVFSVGRLGWPVYMPVQVFVDLL